MIHLLWKYIQSSVLVILHFTVMPFTLKSCTILAILSRIAFTLRVLPTIHKRIVLFCNHAHYRESLQTPWYITYSFNMHWLFSLLLGKLYWNWTVTRHHCISFSLIFTIILSMLHWWIDILNISIYTVTCSRLLNTSSCKVSILW